MANQESTDNYTHTSGAEFTVGEFLAVEGTRWRPEVLNTDGTRFADAKYDDDWDARIVDIVPPAGISDHVEGHLVLEHPDENIGQITRSYDVVLEDNPDGSFEQ